MAKLSLKDAVEQLHQAQAKSVPEETIIHKMIKVLGDQADLIRRLHEELQDVRQLADERHAALTRDIARLRGVHGA